MSCGAKTRNLVGIFRGERVNDRMLFCRDCTELGACELPLLARESHDPVQLLDCAQKSNHAMLRELRRSRIRAGALQERVDRLEAALRELRSD